MVLWVVGFADYPGCGGDDGGGCAVEAVAWHGGQGMVGCAADISCSRYAVASCCCKLLDNENNDVCKDRVVVRGWCFGARGHPKQMIEDWCFLKLVHLPN